MTTRLLTQVIASLLAMLPVGAQRAATEGCTVKAAPARRVELPDGRVVSTDVQSVAIAGGTIMAIGRYAYVFPRSTTPASLPVMRDSIIGFTINPGGSVSLVHTPMRSGPVLFPKVGAGPGGFHLLFASGNDSAATGPAMQDSTAIWYASFANGRWTTPQHVVTLGRVNLDAEATSSLLVRHDTLSFAFPFSNGPIDADSGGVILLRRQGERWFVDTLRAMATPIGVRLQSAPGGSLLALFAPRISPRDKTSRIMIAKFTSTWHEPVSIADREESISTPSLVPIAGGFIASWNTMHFPRFETSRIEWARLSHQGNVTLEAAVDSGEKTYPFEPLVLDEKHPFWLYHGTSIGSAITIATASRDGVITRATVDTPFENPRAVTLMLGENRVLAFTMKQGRAPDDPTVASFTTVLEFRCPRSVQR